MSRQELMHGRLENHDGDCPVFLYSHPADSDASRAAGWGTVRGGCGAESTAWRGWDTNTTGIG